jgi:hypothetical protein
LAGTTTATTDTTIIGSSGTSSSSIAAAVNWSCWNLRSYSKCKEVFLCLLLVSYVKFVRLLEVRQPQIPLCKVLTFVPNICSYLII